MRICLGRRGFFIRFEDGLIAGKARSHRESGCKQAAGALDVADSYQAFLGDGDYQLTVLSVDAAPAEAAPCGAGGAVLHIQQPFVDTKRPVEPHGVVETRDLQLR